MSAISKQLNHIRNDNFFPLIKHKTLKFTSFIYCSVTKQLIFNMSANKLLDYIFLLFCLLIH